METVDSLDSEDFVVRRISKTTALEMISQYHYLHRFPGHGTRSYGLYHKDDLISISTLSIPANTSGVAKKYGLDPARGNMELSRLVVVPDAPKNTASFAVGQYIKLWREDFDWIYSYADTGQNHHGGIYQALNAIYVGKNSACGGYLLDGEPIHPRAVVRRFGTRRRNLGPNGEPTIFDICKEQGMTIEAIPHMIKGKHLYILPIGTKSSRREIRSRLSKYSLPYPKRLDTVSQSSSRDQVEHLSR